MSLRLPCELAPVGVVGAGGHRHRHPIGAGFSRRAAPPAHRAAHCAQIAGHRPLVRDHGGVRRRPTGAAVPGARGGVSAAASGRIGCCGRFRHGYGGRYCGAGVQGLPHARRRPGRPVDDAGQHPDRDRLRARCPACASVVRGTACAISPPKAAAVSSAATPVALPQRLRQQLHEALQVLPRLLQVDQRLVGVLALPGGDFIIARHEYRGVQTGIQLGEDVVQLVGQHHALVGRRLAYRRRQHLAGDGEHGGVQAQVAGAVVDVGARLVPRSARHVARYWFEQLTAEYDRLHAGVHVGTRGSRRERGGC
eukprot:ctg_64.g24